MRRLKLSTKITWKYALIFTSVLLIINLAVFLSSQFYNRLVARNEVETIGDQVIQALKEKGPVTPEMLRMLGAVSPFYVEIQTGGPKVSSLENYSFQEKEGKKTLIKVFQGSTLETDKLIFWNREFQVRGESVTLVVIKDLSVFSLMNTVTLVTLIMASILGIFISYIVGYFISKESFTPILNMTKSAAAIGPLNIHDRIEEPPVDDELKELSVTFNNLLDRLDDAYMKQAKFVSDASHELRTPLTVIKGYNDMLMRWGKDDPEILDEAITAIRQETQNMHILVENLLFSAKGENEKIKLEMTSFSIRELLDETAKDYILSTDDRGFLVDSEDFLVCQDRRMIKQLLRILIDNSLKFTKTGDIITLRAKKDDAEYSLSVNDPGEGIGQEELEKIFERFYVADKARTKDKAGSGLGLSIAKWIVAMHGGEIQAASIPYQHTEIKAVFPLRDENVMNINN